MYGWASPPISVEGLKRKDLSPSKRKEFSLQTPFRLESLHQTLGISRLPACPTILDMPVPQSSHKSSSKIYLYISYILFVLFLWITLIDTPCMSFLSCYFKILSLALTFNMEFKIIISLMFFPLSSSPSEVHIMCMLIP